MRTYFSTFIPGLGKVVENQLKRLLKSFNLQRLQDGLIVYQTDSSIKDIKDLSFLNNSFLQVKPEERIPTNLGESFRVVFSRENELVSVNKERLARVENKILENFQKGFS